MARIELDEFASQVNDQFGVAGDWIGQLQANVAAITIGSGGSRIGFSVMDYAEGHPINLGLAEHAEATSDAFEAAHAAAAATPGGYVYFPGGIFCGAREFRHHVRVVGAGRTRTCVTLAPTVNKRHNVFTNTQNTRSKYATEGATSGALRTYDDGGSVEHIYADGNQAARAANGGGSGDSINDQSTSGCCFGYAGVKNWSLRYCHAANGWLHNYDWAGAYYTPETVGNNQTVPELPFQNVTRDHCTSGNVRVDDAFTVHAGTRFRDLYCEAIWTGDGTVQATSPGYTQNAFEYDETSADGESVGCYAYGFIKGFQVKAHRYTKPSTRIKIIGGTAEACAYSVSLEYSTAGGITQELASALAFMVEIRGFTSKSPQTKWSCLNPPSGFSVLDEQRGLSVYGYNGVLVDGWLSLGGAQNHIYCYGSAKNLDFRHIVGKDCFTEQYGGHTQDAFILFTTTTGNATLRDSWSETPMYGPFFEYQNGDPETSDFYADNIRASKASGASSNWVGRIRLNDGTQRASRIVDLGGYGHGLRVDITPNGPTWEYWDGVELPYQGGRKYVQDADWQRFTMAAGTPGALQASGTTVDSLTSGNELRILTRGRRVEWDGSFLTKTGDQLTGIQTYAKAPGGMWPANEHTVVLITDSGTTYRGWINSAGELRSGTTVTNPLPPNTKVSIVSSTYHAGQGS